MKKGLPLNWVRISLNMHWGYTKKILSNFLENKMLFKMNKLYSCFATHDNSCLWCMCVCVCCVLTKPLQTYCKGEAGDFRKS